MIKICVILVLLVYLTTSYGKPVKAKAKKGPTKAADVKSNKDAYVFLDKFGYNKCGSGNTKATGEGPLCQSTMDSMLKHFQTVFRLPVTGKLDKPTITLMNRPRCSLGDYPLAYSAFKPWPEETLKWKIINEVPSLGMAKTRALIIEAFSDWARYAPLKFSEATGNQNANFKIGFFAGNHSDGYPFDGAGGTLAHAFFPTDGNVHFDATELWTDKYDGFGHNLRLVASHEIGHALGLAHSYDQKALMYPFYQLIQPENMLPKDDRDGIRALYGNNDNNLPTTFGEMTTPVATTIKTPGKTVKTTKKHATTTKKSVKTTKKNSPNTDDASPLSHDRCARFLDAVLGGGEDKWLYTLDYDHVWRYHPDFGHWDTQGLPITDVFRGAEPHMMAGILSPATKKIYLFKGYRIWRFSSTSVLDAGFPKRLHGHGTPFNPIAALYDQGHIWLVKGDLLFQLDEGKLKFTSNQLPKRIDEHFPGVPKHVRTAFTYDQKHYFFTENDRKVYVFDANTRRLVPGYPKPMTTGWFACKELK